MRFADGMPTHRFTVDDVHRMVHVGVLAEDEPVELIDGALIVMTPPGPQHTRSVLGLRHLLAQHYGSLHVRTEAPVQLGPHSMPEPDLSVVLQSGLDFVDAHPTGSDCRLVIEVANTSQRYDRNKADLYATGGIPEYWLVDIADNTVTVYQNPTSDGYPLVTVCRDTDRLPLPGLDTSVTANDILLR